MRFIGSSSYVLKPSYFLRRAASRQQTQTSCDLNHKGTELDLQDALICIHI